MLLYTWLWRTKVPPFPTMALTTKTQLGGLSLLDPIAHCHKMFSQWISNVLDPALDTPCWQRAARIQWAIALHLPNPSLRTSLYSYLQTHPRPQGPHRISGFWKRVTAFYRCNKFSVELQQSQNQRGFPRKVFIVNQNTPEPSKNPVVPRVFKLYPNQPSFDLKKIWLSCHTPFVPPTWTTHCWKILQTVYRTAERTNLNYLCNYCGAADTLSHRYFQCSAITPIWTTLNSVFPSSYLTSGNNINWLFMISSSFLDQDYRIIMFITALWSIHTAFLENMNNNQLYYNLPYLKLNSYTSLVFQNIFFGTNWPNELKNRIRSWTNPWFLQVCKIQRYVQFLPASPPAPLQAAAPEPTDRPPDESGT